MKNKESNKSSKPKRELRKIKHKGFGKKKKLLYPLETSTHLQSIINYTLPNGIQVGALLMNVSDKVDYPEYKGSPAYVVISVAYLNNWSETEII